MDACMHVYMYVGRHGCMDGFYIYTCMHLYIHVCINKCAHRVCVCVCVRACVRVCVRVCVCMQHRSDAGKLGGDKGLCLKYQIQRRHEVRT